MLNRIIIAGRLVADPELKQTPGGTSVATARIACDRNFKNKETGERETDFVSLVAWRNTAEFLCDYFGKGQMLIAEGRLQIRSYTDRDGNKRSVAEVVADSIYFCDSPKSDAAPKSSAPYTPPGDQSRAFDELEDDDGELPF